MIARTYKKGDKIKFAEEKQRYTVRAASGRYLVCTKPFNPKHTVIYTVVDVVKMVRGTENLVFGFGAETEAECQDMLDRIEAGISDISRRNRIPLNIVS